LRRLRLGEEKARSKFEERNKRSGWILVHLERVLKERKTRGGKDGIRGAGLGRSVKDR